jgi:ATPase subunit of ABC transporter with duplicated ATPase domains
MSSTLLDARQITRQHAARTVLDAVDLRVDAGSRIGLVGPNGAGKSTLLRILAGREAPDGGSVRRFGTIGYLPQFAAGEDRRRTVRQTILDRVGLTSAGRALDDCAAALAAGDLDAVEPHAAALERWLGLGGADVDARLRATLADLGLELEFLDRPLGALSGGQAARAGLAALHVSRFDVVLLDEPTNHLDADGLGRLATLLAARPGGVVIVSHDRALLAQTVSETVELDRRTGRATHYRGGWNAYEREREAARARARAEHEQALQRREQLVAAERETRRRAAASRNRARARVHDNDKHSREWVTMRAEEMAGRARKMGGRARRVDVPDAPWEHPALRLELTAAERRGMWVVSLEGVVLRRGNWSLGPLDLAVAHGERVLVSGPNASGKSTLLDALAGELAKCCPPQVPS